MCSCVSCGKRECVGGRTVLWCVFFFFSSRRRHTRLQGDWSSDVCSSDLRQTGYIEGKNFTSEYRSADSNYDLLPALAQDLVSRRVDLIVTIGGTPTARSEERRVGKEGRSRGAPYHLKKKKEKTEVDSILY